MYERPLPSADETPEKAYRRSKTSKHVCKFKLEDDTSRERALRIIEALSVPLMTDGLHRPIINEATNRLLKGEERSKFIEIEDDPILETASEEATEDDIFTPSGEYDFEGAEFDGDEEFADISWS